MDETETAGGSVAEEGGHEGPLNADYISKTIEDATSRIGDSKYLEEGDSPEPKDAKKKKETPAEAPEEEPEEEPEEKEEPEPEEGETDRQSSKEAKTEAKWHQYRKAYHENTKLRAEMADLQKKVSELGNTNEVPQLRQWLQQLSQERDELLRAVEVGSVERSPRWKAEIEQPLDRMWGNIQAIAKRNSLDPQKLATLVANNDDTTLEDYISEARPGDRNHLFAMLPAVQQIEEHKQWLRENATQLSQSDYQAMMQQRQAQMGEVVQQRNGAIERIAPKLEDRLVRFIPKDKRPNIKGAMETIRDFESWKEDVKMYAGMAALILPEVCDQWKATRIALREAKDENVRLRGGTPKRTAGSAKAPVHSVAGNGEDEEGVDLNAPIREITAGMTKRLRGVMGYR
jgi:hypothetical protein